MEYKELGKQFWAQYLWAGGNFVAISGNVTGIVQWNKGFTLGL